MAGAGLPSTAFPRHAKQGVDGEPTGPSPVACFARHDGDRPASHNRRFGYFSANPSSGVRYQPADAMQEATLPPVGRSRACGRHDVARDQNAVRDQTLPPDQTTRPITVMSPASDFAIVSG